MKENLVKSNERYIKDENRKWLIGYLLLNVIIFALFAGFISPTFSDVNGLLSRLKDPQGIIALFAVIFSIVLEGALSNKIKEFLVFWRVKHRLPGHRAFSVIGPKEGRLKMEKLETLFPDGLPSDPKQQNNEWYDLYKKYSDERRVFYSHKAFLLTRDLTALTATAIPLSFVGHLITGTQWAMVGYHLLTLLGILVLVSIAARNYGNRFVANVLLEAT